MATNFFREIQFVLKAPAQSNMDIPLDAVCNRLDYDSNWNFGNNIRIEFSIIIVFNCHAILWLFVTFIFHCNKLAGDLLEQ